MKTFRILILGALAALCLTSSAAEFTLRNSDLPELIGALRSLDGYEKAVDQGPGNPQRVVVQNGAIVKEPYKFSREVRAKLAANLTVILESVKKYAEAGEDLRLDAAEAFEKKTPITDRELTKRARALSAATVKLELSPITVDDLKPGSGDGENPIPVSVLSVLNLLRPPPTK